MKYYNCGVSVNLKTLYRTTPKGEDTTWWCLDCIEKVKGHLVEAITKEAIENPIISDLEKIFKKC